MGYLYLFIALIAGATKGFCGKKISNETKTLLSSIIINVIRMCLCVCIGLIFILIANGKLTALNVDKSVLLISFLSALFTAVFVVSWLFCVRTGAYMMIDVFLTLGVICPLILGTLFFDESVVWVKWIGIALLVVATYIMCSYNNKIKSKMKLSGFLLLVLCGVSNGLTQFTQKWFIYSSPNIDISVFNFYTYLFCTVILSAFLLVFVLINKNDNGNIKSILNVKTIAYVFVMALCLFLHSFFSTLSAKFLSSSQLYPLQQGLSLVLSMLMASLFFKEKLTSRCFLGVFLTFVALLIINVLPNFI